MRILILFLITAFYSSTQASPGSQVFGYECRQIDPKTTYFECRFDEDGLRITQLKAPELTAAEKEKNVYEFNKLALRFFELGGKDFIVKLLDWPKDKERHCSRLRNKPFYKFGCYECTWKYDADGAGICERH